MFQVTVVYQNSEIGYGEGERLSYAKQEALDSVPNFYDSVLDCVEFIIIESELI